MHQFIFFIINNHKELLKLFPAYKFKINYNNFKNG
jgi:hypothetical protein